MAVTDTRDYDPASMNAIPADPATARRAYGTASPRQYGELRMPPGKGVTTAVIRVAQDQHLNLLVPGTADFAAIAPALLDIAKAR
jgi:hypothetical protein